MTAKLNDQKKKTMKHKQSFIRFSLSALLLASLIFAMVSCVKEEAEMPQHIKVGVLLGFSGVGSQNATETQAALEVGLDNIRALIRQNWLDVTIELVYKDTESDPDLALNHAQALIDEGVRLIIGPYTSAEAMAVKELADQHDVLVVSHSAVSTALAIPNDNLLRFVPSDHYQAEALQAMMAADGLEAMVAVVRNDLWSNSLMEAVSEVFLSHGGEIIAQLPFEPDTEQFGALAQEVVNEMATGAAIYGEEHTGLYLISFADGTPILEAVSAAGLSVGHKLYGASAYAQNASLPANASAASFAAETGIKVPVFGLDESAANIYEPIQARIKEMIGTEANIYALAAYDILKTAFLAHITQDPGVAFEEFKKHFIHTASSYFGATGHTELDENGDRMNVYYDFWTIIETAEGEYQWHLAAKYNTSTGLLSLY